MLTCQQATQLLSERQDRPLQVNEKLSLTLHTSMCLACRRFGRQMLKLSDLSKQYIQYTGADVLDPASPMPDATQPTRD